MIWSAARHSIVLATTAVVLVGGTVAGCGGEGGDGDRRGSGASSMLAAPGCGAHVEADLGDADRAGIRVVDLPLVDRSRGTAADGGSPGRDERSVPTRLFVPDRAGPRPLFVWAHGLGGDGASYDDLVCPIVAAGYVVASPTFPRSNGAAPGGPVFDAYTDQPADVSFVIDEVIDRYGPDGTSRADVVDPDRIGVGGHSLGAITTDGLIASTCCTDDRVDGAVQVNGSPRPFPGGPYRSAAVPVLVIHGEEDDLFPLAEGRQLYERADPPKGLVVLEGAGHAPFGPGELDTVEQATLGWLDRYVGDRIDDAELLARLSSLHGATVTVNVG